MRGGLALGHRAHYVRPVQAPRTGVTDKPTITLLGEMFPADPIIIGRMLAPMGLDVGPVVPTREWRELYAALDCTAVGAIHPFYTASIREFEAAGRPIVGSAPVGHDGTEAWLQQIGQAANVPQAQIDAVKNAMLGAIKGALAEAPIKGRITLSGYEGSELLVARLLVESGADLRYDLEIGLDEAFHGKLHPELKKQYSVPDKDDPNKDLDGILLSPRARKTSQGWTACQHCKVALKDENLHCHGPPRYAIANGFCISYFQNI